jgi:hypothetical protein
MVNAADLTEAQAASGGFLYYRHALNSCADAVVFGLPIKPLFFSSDLFHTSMNRVVASLLFTPHWVQ